MAVQVFGTQFTESGFVASFKAHKNSHEANADALMNIAEGKQGDDPRPPYDPEHPDNKWPLMVHHPTSTAIVGKSLKGIVDPKERDRVQRENEKALREALSRPDWRREPYVKPQVAVLDAATEKKLALEREANLMGLITIMREELAQLKAAQNQPPPPPQQ